MIYKKFVLYFLTCFFLQYAGAQTLTVNTGQLNFGDVFENAPDSLLITISNNIGRDVTVTGIKFYDTYGVPAFSTSYSWFTISNGGSQNVWIKFSPRHNILHNSEMIIENDGLRGYISVDLTGQGKYSDHYYDLSENQSEENLKNVLKLITGNGYVSLGYNVARDSMFMRIDNKKINGQGASQNTLECIYTGRQAVGYADRTDAQNTYSFNTEHTFPQSLFSSQEPMRSDLHHLFPTDDVANNQRGDNPFGVVTNPTWNNGGSFSDGTIFEPRDVQKGASARALFYFVVRYQNYSSFLTSQESILRQWHATYLPDAIEKKRNSDINLVQHNKNPFVDYPVFTERITSLSSNSVAPIISAIDLTEDTIIYGTVQPATPVIFNYVIVNNGNTTIHFSNFSLTHPAELNFASSGNDTTLAPGDALSLKIRCFVSNTDSIRAFLSFNTDATGNTQVVIPVFVNDLVYTYVNEIANDFSISPNPAHDYIQVSLDKNSEMFRYNLSDIAGRKIFSNAEAIEGKLSLTGVTPGIFILQAVSKKSIMNKKIIIQ
jgi:hypothetical protein